MSMNKQLIPYVYNNKIYYMSYDNTSIYIYDDAKNLVLESSLSAISHDSQPLLKLAYSIYQALI